MIIRICSAMFFMSQILCDILHLFIMPSAYARAHTHTHTHTHTHIYIYIYICIYSIDNYLVSKELTYYSFAQAAHQGT